MRNHPDDLAPLAADPVEQQKLAFIREHHLVVWRFPRYLAFAPAGWDPRRNGRGVRWKAYQDSANPNLFTFPSTIVEQIAA
jgi:hypothetical protein